MKIKNIRGASGNTFGNDFWLGLWKKHSGQSTYQCQANGCTKTDIVGAHVQKSGSPDRRSYIYPLCSAHSKSAEEIEVSDSCQLVLSNVSASCRKYMAGSLKSN